MARFLHLLKGDAAPVAAPVIEAHCRQPESQVTVVVLDGATAPELPANVEIHRLREGDLDYASLLDLIFEHDHVVSW